MVNTPTPADMLQAALTYRARGWRVLPVAWMGKKPALGDDWQHRALTLSPEELEAGFSAQRNVGVLLGTPSGHLADVDLDCPEALELAPHYLPATLTFGRASKPRSHWLYVAEGASSKAYADDKGTLVELRADKERTPGKSGHQTVFPPSVHEGGEPIQWTTSTQDAPTVVDAGALRDAVARLASACLVVRAAGRDAARAWLQGGACPALCPPECTHTLTRAAGAPLCPTALFRTWRGLPVTPPAPRAPRPFQRAHQPSPEFITAVEAYNTQHAREFPSHGGPCPVCGSPEAFKALQGATGKWACWSRRHDPHAVGRFASTSAGAIWTGDALDLDAHEHNATRADMLRRAGYLVR